MNNDNIHPDALLVFIPARHIWHIIRNYVLSNSHHIPLPWCNRQQLGIGANEIAESYFTLLA